jgi:hypothetical protein
MVLHQLPRFIKVQKNIHVKINKLMRYKVYLDDERTPNDKTWIVVRNYNQFIQKMSELGFDNIDIISFDHDLGDATIEEKTGYDAAKWMVNEYLECYDNTIHFPQVYVHSANPIGSANIIGYVNGFLKHIKKKQTVELKIEPFTVKNK